MKRLSVVLDVVAVLIFVGIGRHVHDHGVSARGLLSTSWPFLIGLGAGWFVLIRQRRSISAVSGGVVVWISTVVFGMILRVVAGQGTAFAFIIVTFAFLGLFMFAWRIVLARMQLRAH
ncbi:MAG: DUF3054 domain-containing protein [Acidimicrobiales bacterium]